MNLLRWVVFALVLASVRVFAGDTATAVATVTAGFVSGITVTAGGSGYTSEPLVTITGGGGSGATGKAILSGDKVAVVLILTAGSRYTSAPAVAVEPPPERLRLNLELVPKVTVLGPPGSSAKIEWSDRLGGPWTAWTSVVVEASGTVLVDLAPGAVAKFYQSVSTTPVGPPGFVWISPGSFLMGSPTNEVGRNADETQTLVTLTRGFWLCDHEVTQSEFVSLMGSNPSWNKGVFPNEVLGDLPVEQVRHSAAVEYCRRLTERERAAGRITGLHSYRLPTEAEWEYSARAGSTAALIPDLDASAWYVGNSKIGGLNGIPFPRPVKLKKPNKWGLYDMIGNVWEWCSDGYGPYLCSPILDPTGVSMSDYRVYRGGCAPQGSNELRFACRGPVTSWGAESDLVGLVGFRVALSVIP